MKTGCGQWKSRGLSRSILLAVTLYWGAYEQQTSSSQFGGCKPKIHPGAGGLGVWGGLAIFSPRPHGVEGTLMPFMGGPRSRPDHLPKALPPKTTSEGRFKI